MIPTEQLEKNYRLVLSRIQNAANEADRKPDEIQLVAVTKYVDSSVIRQLYEFGCRDFGESRPQALWQKAVALSDLDIRWHLIGHLQTNKVRRTLPNTCLIHSGDSLKLLQCIDEEAGRVGQKASVLCEVNISGDSSKHGFRDEELVEAIDEISPLQHLQVKGLMAMASRSGGKDQAQDDFKKMRELQSKIVQNKPENVSMQELSMGMSGDFEQAINSGATLVRVGSILFANE